MSSSDHIAPDRAPSRQGLADALRGRLVLAPLTRGGNLAFRRLCAEMGAGITFSEMAHAVLLGKGERRELALLRRTDDSGLFGVQIAAREPGPGAKAVRMALDAGADLVDLNCGCPIDSVVRRGEGAALLDKPRKLERLLQGLREAAGDAPLLVKIRLGFREGKENAEAIAKIAEDAGADAITVHGRTREQRYRRPADWDRIAEVAASTSLPVIGNGDVLHASDAIRRLAESGCVAVMAARGALIKPWLWQDLAEGGDRSRTPDERLAVYRRWVELAVATWGSDEYGWRRVRWFLEFHVDWWRRYVPEDAGRTGDNTLQGRTQFAPRDEAEAILLAPEPGDLHRACDLILAPFEPPPIALTPSGQAPDPTAGGWG